jgi:hypothetical protein
VSVPLAAPQLESHGAHYGRSLIMKRIAQLAVFAALALGAQAALSEEAIQAAPEAVTESTDASVTIAEVSDVMRDEAAAPAARAERRDRNMLKDLGLLMDDGFPQKGGPIDD